jgi:hypothetical protein
MNHESQDAAARESALDAQASYERTNWEPAEGLGGRRADRLMNPTGQS